MMKYLMLALQFLTILPVRATATVTEFDIAKSASFFVLVGLFQGILLVATDYISGMVFHPDLVAGIVLLVYVLSNGGFHLDGLADTFDAIAIKSSGDSKEDRRKRLSVMKDSTTGPTGVISIVFVILLKYLLLKNISNFLMFTYYFSLFLMPAISKWAMVMSMFHGRPAREDGLGKIFIGKVKIRELGLSTFTLMILPALQLVFFSRYASDNQYIFYAVLLGTMYLFCRLCAHFFNEKIGGLTGDTLGAINEMAEIIFLSMVVIWSRLYI
jgi:adenosylcobinamide-GDP ribazoletransferase